MLRHIGIHIYDPSEIENFYTEILDFEELNRFTLNSEAAEKVFGVAKNIEVVRMKQFGLILELLICPKEQNTGMNHLALEFWHAAEAAEKARKMGYEVVEFPKENKRMARYIKDKAGNIFEIKEINFA